MDPAPPTGTAMVSALGADGVVAAAAIAAAVDVAVGVLRRDDVVAVPTETVYGLAARGLSDVAVAKIYEAKGRPSDNPLILHVKDLEAAWPLWRFGDPLEARRVTALAAAFWPGPLTMVAWASPLVPDAVRGGLPKVAVRVPAHPFALALASALGEPFAAPSANASGRPSPTTAADVLQSLAGRIPLVVDGGRCGRGIESSVVDVTGPRPRLLRPGALSVLELRRVLPDLDVRPAGVAAHVADASPGLRHRHYAPLGGARLIAVAALPSVWGDADVGIIARAADLAQLAELGGVASPREGFVATMPDDVDGYGRALFSALYQAERAAVADDRAAVADDRAAVADDRAAVADDRAAPKKLVIVDVPDDDEWLAVRDRLLRATA